MIHLNNAGSAYEIGRHHGASCPGAVRLACDAWLRVAPIEMPRAEAGIRLVKERLGRFFPECLEEARGIADASGQTLNRILVLNCSDAMIGRAAGGRSCSCIGFVDSDHGPLIGKTADWQVDHAQDLTAWQHYRPRRGEGYRFIHYGGAGTWWSEGGLNEAGLGMVLNGLPGAGAAPDSVPTLPLARGVLQHCASVRESIEWLARYDVMYLGFNLMLADRQGDLASVEVVPGAQGVQRPAGDCLIHTNHCLLPETEDVTLDEETSRTTDIRGSRETARRAIAIWKGSCRRRRARSRGWRHCCVIARPREPSARAGSRECTPSTRWSSHRPGASSGGRRASRPTCLSSSTRSEWTVGRGRRI